METVELYRMREGETVYDLAANLYKDTSLGLEDLLHKNFLLTDDEVEPGTSVLWTRGMQRARPIVVVPMLDTPEVFYTQVRQNVFDMAVQLYGDVEVGLPLLLNQLSNLDGSIPPLTAISFNSGSEFKVGVATDPDPLGPGGAGGIGVMIIESTFIVA
jgi:hypothetical protein